MKGWRNQAGKDVDRYIEGDKTENRLAMSGVRAPGVIHIGTGRD